MHHLYKQGLLKAEELRMDLDLDPFEPVNIFDICERLSVSVRIYNNNMEGIYSVTKKGTHPTIILSNRRPLPRRFFTCGHELGHHVYGHGSSFDEMVSASSATTVKHPNEILVDAFAGHLLMPICGIETEFIKRNWDIKKASSIEFFTIASLFAVGYGTLISHCKANQLISEPHYLNLSKMKPGKLLKSLLGKDVENGHFKIIDSVTQISVIDIEVGGYIFLPRETSIEGAHLEKLSDTKAGEAYKALRAGVLRISSTDGELNAFVRIQKENYSGLAEYRHLEG